MPDYYYIDLYFDPGEQSLGNIVDRCVSALVRAGAEFEKVFMARHDEKRQVSFGEHVSIRPEDLGALAEAYLGEYGDEKNFFISFPHQGRVMFRYPFSLDQALMEEITEEEADTHSSAETLGLTFTYQQSEKTSNLVKASMSFWEEYHLTHSGEDIVQENVEKIVGIVDAINSMAHPFFGAMSPEIHLDTDGALGLLRAGKVPVGNDYVFVGRKLLHLLNREVAEEYGARLRELAEGAMLLDFACR